LTNNQLITQKKKVMLGSIKPQTDSIEFEQIEQSIVDAVIEGDEQLMEEGRMLSDAISYSVLSFVPDLMFEQLVSNFKTAKNLYGERILRAVTGKSTDYLERNISIPEYQRELKKTMSQKIQGLKEKKLLDRKYALNKRAMELASLIMYIDELEKLQPRGMGEKVYSVPSVYGDREDIRHYSRGDRYRDVSISRSVKTAIRRNHRQMRMEDIRVNQRRSRGQIYMVYALDASGSMRGEKIDRCKKAGIALSYKAIQHKDMVGLIVFGRDIEKKIEPTYHFDRLLKEIASIRASSETDMAKTIRESIRMFPTRDVTKHLVLITDAMPTAGERPETDTLEAENVTDMSPLHVDWITEKLHRNPKLRDEIILAKVFCKAQGLYGAESYISGLSGHVLDILVVYFGSFRKLLENAITWHKYKVIDIEGYNSEDDMNESKISPIIVIDPVDKRRNAAAALSTEKFTLFKQKAAEFIERPSAKLFVKTPVTKEGLLKKAGKNVLVMVMAEPIMSKIDVMGSKLLKVHEHILKHMALHGFVMVDSGWQWAPAEEAVSWYIIDPEILSSRREHMGPPTKELPAADKFREKHERCYENKGRLFVEVRRDFRKPEDLIRNLLSDRYVKERTIATKIFISRP